MSVEVLTFRCFEHIKKKILQILLGSKWHWLLRYLCSWCQR